MIRLPTGTKDYEGIEYHKLKYLIKIITEIYSKYHGEFIETPVFELSDTLTNKYGEEEKLIYNIESSVNDDNNIDNPKCIRDSMFKERLSLRYDHTIPLVRYCIMNKIDKIRRCCIGKVYRREATIKSQVRLREFYQADFDYVGTFDEFVPEIEIFMMIQELMKKLNVKNYQILYNYRQNLEYYIKESGMDISNFNSICSSIDKLDKKTPEEVKSELLNKGYINEEIEKLYRFLFSIDDHYMMSPVIRNFDNKFHQMIKSIDFIDNSKIIFRPTLARGSDYYTGIIFEVKLINTDITNSVCGGGRYDKLYHKLLAVDNVDNTDNIFPMIGFTFGIDRLLKFVTLPIDNSTNEKKIWVSTVGNFKNSDPINIKLKIIGKLIENNYSVYYNLDKRKFIKEFQDANKNSCNYIIIIIEDEWINNTISIRNLHKKTQIILPFDELLEYIKT